jgi:cell division protein FtsL
MIKTEERHGQKRKPVAGGSGQKSMDPRGRYFITASFFVMVALLFIYRSTVIVREGATISAVKTEIDIIKTENQHLSLRVAELSSPQRIEEIAITRLGMVHPEKVRSIEIERVAWTPQQESISNDRAAVMTHIRSAFGKIGSALAAVYGRNNP